MDRGFVLLEEQYNISVVPKPMQRPHPGLWQACSSPASFEQPGRNGVGALGVTLRAAPAQVRAWIDLYRKAASATERPVGKLVNNQVAFFTFVHCAETDEEAMRNGATTATAWYTNTAFTVFEARELFLKTAAEQEALLKDPAGGGLTGQFLRDQAAQGAVPNQAQIAIGRSMQGAQVS